MSYKILSAKEYIQFEKFYGEDLQYVDIQGSNNNLYRCFSYCDTMYVPEFFAPMLFPPSQSLWSRIKSWFRR